MRPKRKKDRPALKEILNYEGAKDAFNQLVNNKAERKFLANFLRGLPAFPNVNQPWTWLLRPRQVDSLRSKVGALASEIEDTNCRWGIFHKLAQDRLSHLRRLPALLSEYGQVLEEVLRSKSLRPPKGPSQRNKTIGMLLDAVKLMTGRPHYEEVAVLLNAVDYARKDCNEGGARWDPTILRQLMYRERVRESRFKKSEAYQKFLISLKT